MYHDYLTPHRRETDPVTSTPYIRNYTYIALSLFGPHPLRYTSSAATVIW